MLCFCFCSEQNQVKSWGFFLTSRICGSGNVCVVSACVCVCESVCVCVFVSACMSVCWSYNF